MSLIFLSGPMTKTLRTVWLSAGVRFAGVAGHGGGKHAVELRHVEVGIGDHWVIGGEALRLLDVLGPAVMVGERIDGQTDNLDATLVELGLDIGHIAELARCFSKAPWSAHNRNCPTRLQ